MRLKTIHILLIAILCFMLFVLTVFVVYREYARPWKRYQKEFQRLNNEEGDTGINQIWLQELRVVDRCTTCHQAEDREGFSNAPHPFRTHSGDYLRIHPVKRFGCVICHDGQGEALTADDAHGRVAYSGRPLLKGKFTQASCIRCHPLSQDLPLDATLTDATTLSLGWRLFNEYNCSGCHKLKGYRRLEHIAPSLTRIGSKVNREWLFRWLKKPRDYSAETKMPAYRLKDNEIADIISYLSTLRDGRLERPLNVDLNRKEGLRNRGKLLFESLGCLGCHKIGKRGVSFGPPLSDIGNKVRVEWLYQFLKEPRSYDPKTIIPDFKLNEEDILPLTAYLMSLKKDYQDITMPVQSGDKERGKKLIMEYGCLGCHEIEGLKFQYIAPPLDGIGDKQVKELAFGNVRDMDRSLEAWLRLKVTEPGKFTTKNMIMRMPEFNFNKGQADALVTFLLGMRQGEIDERYTENILNPDEISLKGKRIFERYNCLGCHKLNDKGGEIAPDLTKEGKKSRPEWLFNFLKAPRKIRPKPVLPASMPDFKLSDSDVNTIIEYLSYLSEERYPYVLEERKKVYPADISAGEKLYHEIFACIACHRINGYGGEIGPDHTDLASRLRRQWIEKWVKDPRSIQKDVRMPVFKFEDWQFEAIVNYLMTLGKYRFVEEMAE